MAAGDIYIFPHIPKTGGQTLLYHFFEHMRINQDFVVIDDEGRDSFVHPSGFMPYRFGKPVPCPAYPGNPQISHEQLRNLSREKKDCIRVVQSHDAGLLTAVCFPGRRVKFAIFLREPAPAIVSYYNYRVNYFGETRVFEQWYSQHARNYQAGHLISRFPGMNLRQILSMMYFIGDTKSMSEQLIPVFREIGIEEKVESKNVTEDKHVELSGELRERLNRENALDFKLVQSLGSKGFLRSDGISCRVSQQGSNQSQ